MDFEIFFSEHAIRLYFCIINRMQQVDQVHIACDLRVIAKKIYLKKILGIYIVTDS